jgi:hypothetical protein
MTTKNAKDRLHDFKMVVVASLFTIVGILLTLLFQYFQNNRQIEEQNRQDASKISEQRRDQATLLFNELSPLIDTRLYNWRQIAWGLEDTIPEDALKKRYSVYQETFYQWNHNLNKNRAFVCRFFGPKLGETFELQITPGFIYLHQAIYKLIKMPRNLRPIIPPDSLNSLADSLNDIIYQFNNDMAELIRSGKVGLTDSTQACDTIRFDPTQTKAHL